MAKKYDSTNMSNVHNVLATSTVIKGEIYSEENFRIDGQIEGTVNCKGKIVVGPESIVKGTIICENIEVFGKIDGTVTCSDIFALRATGTVLGEIRVKALEIELGAQLEATCVMLKDGATEINNE